MQRIEISIPHRYSGNLHYVFQFIQLSEFQFLIGSLETRQTRLNKGMFFITCFFFFHLPRKNTAKSQFLFSSIPWHSYTTIHRRKNQHHFQNSENSLFSFQGTPQMFYIIMSDCLMLIVSCHIRCVHFIILWQILPQITV